MTMMPAQHKLMIPEQYGVSPLSLIQKDFLWTSTIIFLTIHLSSLLTK